MKLSNDVFNDVNSALEVYKLSQELKERGYDPKEVNHLAGLRKRELITRVQSVNTLTKVTPRTGSMKKDKVSRFMIQVDNLFGNRIQLTGDGKVIL